MSITVGYLYARPLSEEDWDKFKDTIDPHFLGLMIGWISMVAHNVPEFDGANTGNNAEFNQSEVCYAWVDKGWPYAESAFLWNEREHCKPPLSVAETADRLADGMEAGDEYIAWMIPAVADRLGWKPEEVAADCIKTMRDLAKACRFVAEKGATEVTVFLQS